MNKAQTKYLKIGAGVLALAVVAAGGVLFVRSDDTNTEVVEAAMFRVRQGPLRISVTESGNIQAAESLDVKCEVERGATVTEIVPEGTVVTEADVEAGKVLVRLDSSELEERLNQQEIDFASSEASLTEARESYDIQVKQNESDIAASELNVQFARMDLEKYLGSDAATRLLDSGVAAEPNVLAQLAVARDPNALGGQGLQTWRNLMSEIELSQERLNRAADKYMWTQRLYEKEFVARTELEADRLALRQQEISKQQTETDRDLFLRYDLPKQVAKLLSDYREALRELDRTLAQSRSRLAQAEARLNSAQARFNLQKQQKEKLERQIAACVVRATKPGLVIYGTSGDPWRGRNEPIEVGAEIREGQKILTIPNLSQMMVETKVHESSVDRVRPGLRAVVTVDALPDKRYTGAVKKVAPLPDPQNSFLNPDLKVYNTQVMIDGQDDALRPGMSAKVEIVVQDLNDVMYVPVQAVARRGGRQVCYVQNGSSLEERLVTTGLFNESFVVIETGLTSDDAVSLRPPKLSGEDMGPGVQPEQAVAWTQGQGEPADGVQAQPIAQVRQIPGAAAAAVPEASAASQTVAADGTGVAAPAEAPADQPRGGLMMGMGIKPEDLAELRKAAQDGTLAEKLKEKGIELDDAMVEQIAERLKSFPAGGGMDSGGPGMRPGGPVGGPGMRPGGPMGGPGLRRGVGPGPGRGGGGSRGEAN